MKRRRTALITVTLAAGLAFLLAGCPKVKTEPSTTQPSGTQYGGNPAPAPPPQGGGGGNVVVPGAGGGVMAVRGAGMKTDARNQLSQIALFYNQMVNDVGAPANQQQFMDYIKRDANKEYLSLQEGYFYIVPNARMASGVVIAYEQQPDNTGRHFVAMGDRSVTGMTTQELKAALGQR